MSKDLETRVESSPDALRLLERLDVLSTSELVTVEYFVARGMVDLVDCRQYDSDAVRPDADELLEDAARVLEKLQRMLERRGAPILERDFIPQRTGDNVR